MQMQRRNGVGLVIISGSADEGEEDEDEEKGDDEKAGMMDGIAAEVAERINSVNDESISGGAEAKVDVEIDVADGTAIDIGGDEEEEQAGEMRMESRLSEKRAAPNTWRSAVGWRTTWMRSRKTARPTRCAGFMWSLASANPHTAFLTWSKREARDHSSERKAEGWSCQGKADSGWASSRKSTAS